MKIGLDARNLLPRQTGIGRCVYHLITNLAKLDHDNEYIIIKHTSYSPVIVDQPNFREISIPHDPSSLRSCLIGFDEINDLNLDVYHSFFHFLPGRIHAKRVIVTLHDLIWIDYPDLVFEDFLRQQIIGLYGKIFIKKALKNSDVIVAISKHTKQHAIKRYNIPSDHIHVIHHGIDSFYFKQIASLELPENFKSMDYIFSIGHTRPYKNIPRVIKAFKLICDEFPEIRLVIVGRGDYRFDLNKIVLENDITNRVVFTGHLPDENMIPIFKNALFLVFPSLIEGFGFPLIEAMALGCPVLASNVPVIEEIAGDAYEKVNPESIDSIAEGMRKLISCKVRRDDLRESGYERAKRYSWEKSAKKLLSVLIAN